MIVTDLPEPKKREISAAEKIERRRQVLFTFLQLIALYVCLHKLVIPVVLKLTALKGSAYAHVDLWFINPLLLVWSVRGSKVLSPFAGFIASRGISYAALEIVQVLKGTYPGWLGVSHLLSSVPFALIAIGLLTGPFMGRKAGAAWLGAFLAAAVKLLLPLLEVL